MIKLFVSYIVALLLKELKAELETMCEENVTVYLPLYEMTQVLFHPFYSQLHNVNLFILYWFQNV